MKKMYQRSYGNLKSLEKKSRKPPKWPSGFENLQFYRGAPMKKCTTEHMENILIIYASIRLQLPQ